MLLERPILFVIIYCQIGITPISVDVNLLCYSCTFEVDWTTSKRKTICRVHQSCHVHTDQQCGVPWSIGVAQKKLLPVISFGTSIPM